MATALSTGGRKSSIVSDEERRWVVVGICLTKVLTPALRDVLANEIPTWYQTLLQPPCEIDKQTFAKREKTLPPSTLKLNYDSINNNTAHKSPRAYDYTVKDPLSLSKLFMKPFMANFTGFDQTMDASAVLSVLCEAQPFIASGAAGIAKKVRQDIRNEWAHCNFSHWTEPNFQAALQSMELLIKKAKLTPAEEKKMLDELDSWKDKGFQLCFGQPLDPALLNLVNSDIADLYEFVKLWKVEVDDVKSQLLKSLKEIQGSLEQEMQDLKERQVLTEKDVDLLKHEQLSLRQEYSTTVEDVERIKNEVAKICNETEETPYVFMAPKRNQWFSGRESELEELQVVLEKEESNSNEKVIVAAVSGLGGCGKTSLVAEYAKRKKDYYQGGVFWFSGEDDTNLANSVNDLAFRFGTFHDNSFNTTLTATLTAISRIQKSWLVVLDDLDVRNLSPSLLKLVSGPWQQGGTVCGHLIITTRRKPMMLTDDIRGFKESCCLKLGCFGAEEAKAFVFQRTGIIPDEKVEPDADSLVQKLGRLPLALEQACAYIKNIHCTLSSYLELYKKQSLQLLNRKKASPVSVYESPERQAVCTTWLLNFDHIKQNENGMVAIRFLNACAFMNPNEIQQELINVGEPLVEDGAYRDYVNTPIGSREVFNMLTDFSLFKETKASCFSVHRLVQEVIRENLSPAEKAESIVDAVRLLRFAFLDCCSPDDLLTSVANERHERSSVRSTDPSLFYKWHKLCLHSYELRKNVEAFLDISHKIADKRVFLPETARIVYESALHLNVNGNNIEAKQVADFAYRILDWGDSVLSEEELKTLFPHLIPLPESVRRFIQYSCSAPSVRSTCDPQETGENFLKSEHLETTRLNGNQLYKESKFIEAIDEYSSGISRSKGTNLFDPRLLSNRASAYLKLKQYGNALKDAEDYLKQCPDCWKGYARKALALHGLNKKLEATCAAALAFYRKRKIFIEFPPFKTTFPDLEKRISVCDNLSSLCTLLPIFSPFGSASMDNKIVVLEPGKYRLSAEGFPRYSVVSCALGIHNIQRLLLGNCILVGVENSVVKSGVTLSFLGNFGIGSQSFMTAVNISFVFDMGNWHACAESDCFFSNCSFTSNLSENPAAKSAKQNINVYSAFSSAGNLNVENCSFKNCKGTGLLISGDAKLEESVFSGNECYGLKVDPGGCLMVKKSKMHGNWLGLHIGPLSGKCTVLDCEVYDNKYQGIGVTYSTDVTLIGNSIYHNDRHGIFVDDRSFAVIERNKIFENCWYGIATLSDACCRVSHNYIYDNKCGGVHVVPIASGREDRQSVVEFNKIVGNGGPGIDESVSYPDVLGTPTPDLDTLKSRVKMRKSLRKAKCAGNKLEDNEEEDSPPPLKDILDICSCCRKKGFLKKCNKCFTAGYCDRKCQKNHWKKHKNSCRFLLEKSSVLLNVLPKQIVLDGFVNVSLHIQGPNLQSMGPEYAEAPEHEKRFIVKIQACDGKRKSNSGGSLLTVQDRSLTVNGDLEDSRMYNLVRHCGSNCKSYGWKKRFLWALLEKNDSLRVFSAEFPPYQPW